jgi:hypothetical protein
MLTTKDTRKVAKAEVECYVESWGEIARVGGWGLADHQKSQRTRWSLNTTSIHSILLRKKWV